MGSSIRSSLIREASSAVEKLRAYEFGLTASLTDPRYGLQSEQTYRLEYNEPESYDYLLAYRGGSDELEGDIRVRYPYSISPFDNFNSEHEHLAQVTTIADIGIHLSLPFGHRIHLLRDLWALLIAWSERQGAEYIYGQVHPVDLSVWQSLGFLPATAEFEVSGWAGTWVGIVCDLRAIIQGHANSEFCESWKQRTGRALHSPFWSKAVTGAAVHQADRKN